MEKENHKIKQIEENEIKDIEEEMENVLLIACYEKPFSKKALKRIRGTIEKEKPTKIIVLKIVEEPEVPDFADEQIGDKTREEFEDSVVKDKKTQVDSYTKDVLKITDETGIPTEVRFRKADLIADEIVNDYEKMEVDHLIIHKGDKDLLERLRKGEVEKDVKKEVDSEDITTV